MNDHVHNENCNHAVPESADLNFNMTLGLRVNMRDDDPRVRSVFCGEAFMLHLDNVIGLLLFNAIKDWTAEHHPEIVMSIAPNKPQNEGNA